ncbi:DUF1275 domain-containing protein [Aureimonas altamirensis]|uniref:YoaK family protein n=1 Tax=Aureimonas altamirensis TaxID=370622 RepID=UPI001E52914C|nr:YoaK family protein [Aureimonas altamirensis]UHD46547.1 DUF1275 domain-containing protein [Aureimonas altamirensis]
MTTPHRRRHRRLRRGRLGAGLFLTVCLSALAGMTDAIGLMMIGSYVSFMSGNTTEFAAALVRGQYQHAAMLAAILFVFVAGNALGEIFIRLTRRNHVPLLFVTAVLIAVPMALPGAIWPMLAAVLAMGMLNSGIEQVEGQAFGITFVTGALSRFGRGIGRRLMGETGGGWPLQIVPFVGMLVGATAGALAYRTMPETSLAAPAVFSFALGIATLVIPDRWRRSYVSPQRVRRPQPSPR